MAIVSRVIVVEGVVVVGLWIMMLPKTAVHWLSSAEVWAKFGVEQLQTIKIVSYCSCKTVKSPLGNCFCDEYNSN